MSSSFDISFTGKCWNEDGSPFESIRLLLGEREEYEPADLTNWSQEDYRQQWISELSSLSRSASKGALIVSLHEPAKGYRIWVWTMWKDGEQVRFQNRLLFMSEVARGFDPSRISDFIGDYQTHSENGERISEWQVPLASIQEFVKNQSSQ